MIGRRHATLFCVAGFAICLLLTGCGGDGGRSLETPAGATVKRVYDAELIEMGRTVYQRHCSGCHGRNAEGADNWQRRGPDGNWPPPPLNGSGHAWHHPTAVLTDIIRNGSPPGEGNMPAWKDKLSNDEIRAVIAWFQAQWPDPIYGAWYDVEQRAAGR